MALTDKLTTIGDAIRNKTGDTELMTLDEMATAIDGIEVGVDTSDATATASDILAGETAYVDGEKVTGTIETKTASNLSASGATVTVPAGYYASQATKSVSSATQATPSVTVDSNGLITATATQTAGYVAAGTKSATKQLAFQAAKTVTPSALDQVAVSAGYYTGGAVTVKGDANLVTGNIKSGVNIFGVNGTYEGDKETEDALVERTLYTYTNDRVTNIGEFAFYSCNKLTTVSFPVAKSIGANAFRQCMSITTASFPAATNIGDYAFYGCSKLTTVSFPVAKSIGANAFDNCSSLTTASFPAATNIGDYAFYGCSKLTTVSFPAATSIGNFAFDNCSSLTTVYLMASTVCTLANSHAFSSAGIKSTVGSIFVPASLVASYKAATNWTYFSNRIFSAP